MRQETVGKHVLHADSIYLVWRTKEFHIQLKTTGAKTTFTNGGDAGPLQYLPLAFRYVYGTNWYMFGIVDSYTATVVISN